MEPRTAAPGAEPNDLFELAPSEVLTPFTFREGARKHRVIHAHQVPSLEDFLAHESKLQARIREIGEQSQSEERQLEAAEELWNRTAKRVEGYPVRAGEDAHAATELCQAFPDTWRTLVPIAHKMVSVNLLRRAALSDRTIGEDEAYVFDPASVTVLIDGWQGGFEFVGLAHKLRRQTPQEAKDFSLTVSSNVWLRGARVATSLIPPRMAYLVKLYNQLIESVAGYAVKGVAISSREDAVRYVWPPHKACVVRGLFSVEEDSIPEADAP